MTSAGPLIVPAGLLDNLPFDPGWIVSGILLIVLIVAGCMAVVRVRRWRQEDEPSPSAQDQLLSYQAMVERGEMDPQEFERIRAHMERKSAETSTEPRFEADPPFPATPPTPPDTRIQPPPGQR